MKPTSSGVAFDAAAAGNAEAGKKRAYTCTGCHGIPGYKNTYPMYSVPRIAGQSETYLVNALNAYKKGERKHPTMHAMAQTLSEQDIADTFAAAREAFADVRCA